MARTTGIFPGWTGKIPREKSGEFEGKIRLDHEPSFDELVRHYPQTQNKFIKAPLKHTIFSVPYHDTLVSAMLVYPIPSDHNPIEILTFICVQFTVYMEVIVVAQRGALICPDYKLTN